MRSRVMIARLRLLKKRLRLLMRLRLMLLPRLLNKRSNFSLAEDS